MLAFLLILLFVYNKRPNNSKSLLYLPSAALTLATQGSKHLILEMQPQKTLMSFGAIVWLVL